MIYISLTTVPDRLTLPEHTYNMTQCLESLLNQATNQEYKVIFNIPYRYKAKDQDYVIPDWLNALEQSNSKLVINRCEDYGPTTKIIGTLLYSNNPEDTLIIVDDDQYYNEGMIDFHIRKRLEHPNECICFRGDKLIEKRTWIDSKGNTKFCFYNTAERFPVLHDQYIMIPGHWHSVGYKRSFFEDDFLDSEFLSGHWSDDILTAYYMCKKGRYFRVTKWENETDFRPVNEFGRPSTSFPIDRNLPYNNSGCYELRKKPNGGFFSDSETYPQSWVEYLISVYYSNTILNG